jgi:hypothetical protein
MKLSIRTPAVLITALVCSLNTGCSGADGESDGERWTSFMREPWTLAPGSEEKDHCVRVTLSQDIYVSEIRPVAPRGTHHTFVSLSDSPDDPGCTYSVGRGELVYASGAGSQGLKLPKGVGLKLPAGKTVYFSLHLFNTSTEPLSGVSGLDIVRMAPSEVRYEAGTTLAGSVALTILPGNITLRHTCQLTDTQTVYAVFPHMHQLGTHLKTKLTVAGATQTVHDAEFNFNEQYQIPIGPLEIAADSTIETECSYYNPGPNTVRFGESSDTEMCFSVLFGYPKPSTNLCGIANPYEQVRH